MPLVTSDINLTDGLALFQENSWKSLLPEGFRFTRGGRKAIEQGDSDRQSLASLQTTRGDYFLASERSLVGR